MFKLSTIFNNINKIFAFFRATFLVVLYIFLIFIFLVLNSERAEATNVSYSGILYNDAGINENTDGSITIKIVVDGSGSYSTTTGAGSGFWQIDNVNVSATSSLMIFVDGISNYHSSLLVKLNDTNSLTNLHLYKDYLTLRSQQGTSTPITNTDLATYDTDNDSDIQFTANSGTLVQSVGQSLYIDNNTNYLPQGEVTIGRSLIATSTAITSFSTTTFSFISTSTATITGPTHFDNLTFNGQGGDWYMTNSATTTDFIITNGTVTAPTALTVTGNFINNGTYKNNSGTLYLDNTEQDVVRYLAGRDSNGSSNLTGGINMRSLNIVGNYMYVTKNSNAIACSQTAGSAEGCELMVFDISSSTNPVYVAGRDANGLSNGTSSMSIYTSATQGSYLYVGKFGDTTACSQTAGSAVGCELMVFDISSSTNPVYVAGRDGNGLSNGTSSASMYSLIVNGNYLYAGKDLNSTACSQNVGSAHGCEVAVFDISSSTNPIYVAGRDVSGSSTGTSAVLINNLTISGNYLYVGKNNSTTACSQTAGSAVGCELMVFDISSSTNPVYVAGRDASGSSTGVGGEQIIYMKIIGNYIYLGKSADDTDCSQTAGSAIGCELMVFDISSSTNPVYVAGRDSDGTNIGTGLMGIYALTSIGNYLYVGKEGTLNYSSDIGRELMVFDISSSTNPIYVAGRDGSGLSNGTSSAFVYTLNSVGNYLYAGKGGNSTACSQTAGSAQGCELMVFDTNITGTMVGNLTSTSSLNNVVLRGYNNINSNASTSNLTITSTGNSKAYSDLSISGNYNNQGIIDLAGDSLRHSNIVYFSGTNQDISGTLNATSSLPDVIFTNSGTKTFNNIASTSDFTINQGVTVDNTYTLTTKDFTNHGTFTTTNKLYTDNFTNNDSFTTTADLSVIGDYTNSGDTDLGDMVEITGFLGDYVAGRDSAGSVSTGNINIRSLNISGDYIYVTKNNSATACSQTAGSADGCELMVFDISSSTNPVYVAGRDSNGLSNGTSSMSIYTSAIQGNYLYVGKFGDSTACSDTVGSAVGCELMVFDISSSTNPVYVAGRDTDGSSGGTTAFTIWSLMVQGNYLYVGRDANSTACSDTVGSAVGCELMVFDISSSTNPVYVAGRDSNGLSNGTSSGLLINNLIINDSYIYVGKNLDSTACSQTAGSARGCELMVFDISSSTNPVYVAGRDSSGSSSGTGAISIVTLKYHNNKLYVGKNNSTTACSQTAGSAIGCELMVFDISSSTNPVYVAGRDTDGSSGGILSVPIQSVDVYGNYLYVGKGVDASVCSQVSGFAYGCELMVFDISSSTNPVYVAGRDSDGSDDGTGSAASYALVDTEGYLYVGKGTNSTACSQTAGSAVGCELMVIKLSSNLSGNLTENNSLPHLKTNGFVDVIDNASTTDLTIATSSIFYAPSNLSIQGDMNNQGDFSHGSGTVFLIGLDNNISGTTTFYSLSKISTTTATTTFSNGSLFTFEGNLTLSGNSSTSRQILRSSINGQDWFIDPTVSALSFLDVKDANNLDSTFLVCGNNCLDSGNNTNWSFAEVFVSGTIFSDFGLNELNASGTKITVLFNNQTYSTTTVSGSGGFYISGFPSTFYAGEIIELWADDSDTKSVLLLKANNDLSLTNLHLYKDYLTLRSQQGTSTPITNTDLATYDTDNDSDIQFTANSGTLVQSVGQSLYIDNNTNYLPQGEVTIGRSLIATSTAITSFSTTTFSFISTSTATITGPTHFDNLTFNGQGGDWYMTNSATTTDFIITNGTVTAPTALTVTGNFINNGTYKNNSGTLYLDNTEQDVVRYLAGRDSTGDSTGSGTYGMYAVANKGSYLYIGKGNSSIACSQTAGSAHGCELMVFDISSSTNPVYVAGRDASGSSSGTGNVGIFSLFIEGNYLYVGKSQSNTACSQTAGSAVGCELMVFDISSSTNPIYVAGRDASGSSSGTEGNTWINDLKVNGSYLYVAKSGLASACSSVAGSASGCELMVFDISSSTNPIYQTGLDSDGMIGGNTTVSISSIDIYGDKLYLGKNGYSLACSQSIGFASGCEIMIYDISSTTNPYPDFESSIDVDGSSIFGTGSSDIGSLITQGNYLYVGKYGDYTACSQTAGSAHGCELMVFDISSSTNPVYVAGRDVSGSSNGTEFSYGLSGFSISNNYLYVGNYGNLTACSQTAGSAEGCELMVFDISSSTNPMYVAGRDSDGSGDGSVFNKIYFTTIIDTYLYVVKGGDGSTACSQTAGSAEGCELMVFDTNITGTMVGNLTSTSSLNNVVLRGYNNINSNASTSNLTITSTGNSKAYSDLSISGNYNNQGIIDLAGDSLRHSNIVYFSGTNQDISGTLNATSSLPDVIFTNSGTKTFNNIASTSDFTINQGVTVDNTYTLTTKDFTNHGTFTTTNKLYTDNFTNNDSFTTTADLSVIGDYTNSGDTDLGDMVEITGFLGDYVAGRDSAGSENGTSFVPVNTFAKKDNYLYVGKGPEGNACSQTAGSADGCELMVFDISSSTNPVYVAGRDSGGSGDGSASVGFLNFVIVGNYLYAGKSPNITACSQTAGSAHGCELMVFDISSSTNPVYVAGRDASGSSSGTGNVGIFSLFIEGNYLYVGRDANSTACSDTAGSAHGCELMVFDISSSTNPVYVAGRDASGSSSGTGNVGIFSLFIEGNYLYVGKSQSNTACSQTAGSAVGCELMVFDISSSTNPVYVAGRDSGGSGDGSASVGFLNFVIVGNYLYAGKSPNITACSQTAGSAHGCELMVFDISSSTNPVYVAGRDTDGSSGGTTAFTIWSLMVQGNYLYVGRDANSTACSDTVGSAVGCELMVFDISSSTNPVYVAGRDVGGMYETSAEAIFSVVKVGNYIYVGKDGNSTFSCLEKYESAQGCELTIFKDISNLSGNLTENNSLPHLKTNGFVDVIDNASTTDLTIATSSIFYAPSNLSIQGDMNNQGDFSHGSGTVFLIGLNQNILTNSTTTFYSLRKQATTSDTLTFSAGGNYEIVSELFISGSSGQNLSLRSTATDTEWFIDPQGTVSVSYLDVKDSNNVNVTEISCELDCIDSGNNTNWFFTEPVIFSSLSDNHFYVGQATTTLNQITILKNSSSTDITTVNDIKITIATSTDFHFDSSVTTLVFSGSASAKVSSNITYEDNYTTLVINVTSDFVNGDELIIEGISVGSFGTISTTSGQLKLHSDGSVAGEPKAIDTKNVNITGSLILSNHTLGQVENQFDFQNKTNEPVFAFSIEPNGENATITDMVLTLSGVQEVTTDEFSNFELYIDSDNDKILDGSDLLIDNSGILTINGQFGAITFSSDFLATTSKDYLVVADTDMIDNGDMLSISLATNGISSLGLISNFDVYVTGDVEGVQHLRNRGGGGGVSARIGGSAPTGNSIETGGNSGGGDEEGQDSDDENISFDPNFFKPSATGDVDNDWSNPTNAYDSDGVYATANTNNFKQTYSGFGFGVPNGNNILGIEIKVDISGTTAAGSVDISLSWDGGSSYTTAKATPTLSGTDVVYLVGGTNDTWGRSWTNTDFNSDNFRLRINASPSTNTIRLDALEVRVYHQSSGGGAGGGGGI